MRALVPLLLLALAGAGADAGPRRVAAKTPAAAAPAPYAARAEVDRFAAELALAHDLPLAWIRAQLAQAQLQPAAQRLILPPPAGTAKNWAAYRERFVEPRRIAAGVAFWAEHAAWIERAQAEYGVPASIIVGIIGVETFYGRNTGNLRVLDVLATLAFDFPDARRDRSAFFRDELAAFLLLCHRDSLEPSALRGSYAGAIGLPQFMPSSILRWAVDFDGDGRVDLADSAADAIGSVANFLAQHGWERDLPITFAVAAPSDASERALLLVPDILPSFSADQLAEHGAELDDAGRAHPGPLALVELQNGSAAPSYVAGTRNFYVLTRYNRSSYYAMAVITLGDAVQRQR